MGSKAARGESKYFNDFQTLPWSMFTLFRCFTDGCSAVDGTPLQVHLAKEFGVPFMVIYVFVFLFVTIGILNLILGMFVDNVFTASRRQSQLFRGKNSEEMKNRLVDALYNMSLRSPGEAPRSTSTYRQSFAVVQNWSDYLTHSKHYLQEKARLKASRRESAESKLDEGHKISKKLFTTWLHDKEFVDLLNSMDINTANRGELFDVLDRDLTGDLYFRDIIDGLMRMRGPPTKSDSVAALLGVRHVTKVVEDIRKTLESVHCCGGPLREYGIVREESVIRDGHIALREEIARV